MSYVFADSMWEDMFLVCLGINAHDLAAFGGLNRSTRGHLRLNWAMSYDPTLYRMIRHRPVVPTAVVSSPLVLYHSCYSQHPNGSWQG